MPRDLITAIIGCCIPPINSFQKKGFGTEVIIGIVLMVIPFCAVFGVLYGWHVQGIDPKVNILCLCIAPLGLYMSKKSCDGDVWICLLLWLCLYPLAIIWAYHKA